jgi:PAS domain S-box-containing protein
MRAGIWEIIDSLPVSFYIKDKQSRFIYVNQASAKSLGLSDPVEALNKTDLDFFEPSIAKDWRKEEQAVMRSGKHVKDKIEQERLCGAKNPAPWVLTCKMPLRDSGGIIIGLVGISKVITSTKEMMDHVLLAVSSAKDGLWYRNYLSGEAWYSARWKGILGYNDKDLPNKRELFRTLVYPEDWPDVENACTEHMAGSTPFYECLFRMKHRDGQWRWIHSRGKARLGPGGQREEFAGSHTDITDYKVKTDLYEQILEMLPALVFLKDGDRRFRYVNKEVEEYFKAAVINNGSIHGRDRI